MTRIESIQFSCTCGRRLAAQADQAGRTYRCPGCGEPVRVPNLGSAAAMESTPPPEAGPSVEQPPGLFGGRAPTTIGELLLLVLGGWSIIAFVCLLAMFF